MSVPRVEGNGTARCDAPRASPGTPGALKGGSGVKDGGAGGAPSAQASGGFAERARKMGIPAPEPSEALRAQGILDSAGDSPPALSVASYDVALAASLPTCCHAGLLAARGLKG